MRQRWSPFAPIPPDVVLLDVMLPGIDGLEVLRQLRMFSDAYVILVTARAEEVDKLVGLGVGADDYVTKPFSPREVTARVQAVLRRGRGDRTGHDAPLRFQDCDHRPGGPGGAGRTDASVTVSSLEFDLLVALAEAPGRVFSSRNCWNGSGGMTSTATSGWSTSTSAACAPGSAIPPGIRI